MWKSRIPEYPRISVIRHGESENNVLGLECADPANAHLFGLTERGRKQVENAASHAEDIDLIVTSPLRRAKDSAEITSRVSGAPVIVDELLIEQNMGIFECKPEAERLKWKLEHNSNLYPGAETPQQMEHRADRLLGKIQEQYQREHVLLVSHGSLLMYFLRRVFDEIDWEAFKRDYTNENRRIFEVTSSGIST